MIGTIIGDIIGSRFEYNNVTRKDFPLFDERCDYTDDSIITLAIAKAVKESKKNVHTLPVLAVHYMQAFGSKYPNPCGSYGTSFNRWLKSADPQPYNSFGNGAAMRVSACGFAADSVEEAIALSKAVTEVTHNHPEGIKGAEATAVAIRLAREGKSKEEIKKYITDNYYVIDYTVEELRTFYYFDVSCQGTVPQALQAFFESTDFEDAIRNAMYIGGDSDTIGAITGAVAEAYYGVPTALREKALSYLDEYLKSVLLEVESVF